MSNFIETYKQGKQGFNVGLTTGIPELDAATNGIQRKNTIGIAAAQKVGKTTFVDFSYVLSPYLEAEEKGTLDNVEWIYFSYEIDRVSKEYKYASFFMAHDYQQYNFTYKDKLYGMNPEYLQGKQLHINSDGSKETIPVSKEHEELLKKLYERRIIPIFGEYSATGQKIKEGKIIFIDEPENPTGLNKYLIHYAELHGTFNKEKYTVTEEGRKVDKYRIVSYAPNNPNKTTIIITDHIRKLPRERGFTMKENIDKWLEYSTILRNRCFFTFVHLSHSNRGVSNVERLRFAGEFIYPTADDVKDSGNLPEECTILITMFNPNDEKYNLDRHFGTDLTDNAHPNYRSIHIADARNVPSPVHMQVNMFGGINMFAPLV